MKLKKVFHPTTQRQRRTPVFLNGVPSKKMLCGVTKYFERIQNMKKNNSILPFKSCLLLLFSCLQPIFFFTHVPKTQNGRETLTCTDKGAFELYVTLFVYDSHSPHDDYPKCHKFLFPFNKHYFFPYDCFTSQKFNFQNIFNDTT